MKLKVKRQCVCKIRCREHRFQYIAVTLIGAHLQLQEFMESIGSSLGESSCDTRELVQCVRTVMEVSDEV